MHLPSIMSRRTVDRAHPHYISLKLHEISLLFNSMDPSPLPDRELDERAEEFIVDWVHELPREAPFRLRVYLDQWPTEDPRPVVTDAIHSHFGRRARLTDLEFRRLLKQGRTSLIIGLTFLSVCLVLGRLLAAYGADAWAVVTRESLTIAGWVAMWRPMQIYLYEWWPLRQRGQVYSKLESVPVEVLQRAKAQKHPSDQPTAAPVQGPVKPSAHREHAV
jgi:hypothetical protein